MTIFTFWLKILWRMISYHIKSTIQYSKKWLITAKETLLNGKKEKVLNLTNFPSNHLLVAKMS